ncbi:hypothetical protein [Burkholderia vietnamiensis]|uniref:hypothetical protein n=1 Tax=Burkholderia vietnamiensis TaxID=60552 RepID=UPI001CF3444B|nr:hypothetical protein [Burkholderia vietnamiensis]MCA8197299.1 hypothetical protein [Burkholderia vietnamiensis]
MAGNMNSGQLAKRESWLLRWADSTYEWLANVPSRVDVGARSLWDDRRKVFRALFVMVVLGAIWVIVMGAVNVGVEQYRGREFRERAARAYEVMKQARAHGDKPAGWDIASRPSLEDVAVTAAMGRCMETSSRKLDTERQLDCSSRLISDVAINQGEARATAVRDALVKEGFEVHQVFLGAGALVGSTERAPCGLSGVTVTGNAHIDCAAGNSSAGVAGAMESVSMGEQAAKRAEVAAHR